MCIIQNMLRYYNKQFTNANLLKPNIMKLTYTVTFNTNGTTIQNLIKRNALNDEGHDIFIKSYD